MINAHCRNKINIQIILSTAQVYVRDIHGERKMCRVLLDPGSQSNMMTQELLQNLKLSWTKRSIPISGINQMQTDTSKVAEIKIKATNNAFSMEMECLVSPAITMPIPQRKIEANEIVLPKDV